MLGLAEDYRNQTRRVKAGNSNRRGAVTAAQARIGKEYVFEMRGNLPDGVRVLRKWAYSRTRVNTTVVRRRKRW